MYSPQAVHCMLKGDMRRTVMCLGPGVLGPRLRVREMALGSKSGGKYLVITFLSDMVAVYWRVDADGVE